MMQNLMSLALLGVLLTVGGTSPPPEPGTQAQSPASGWVAGAPYHAGDLVSYLGVTYQCLRDHTSRAGQEPPAAPDLWRVFSGADTQPPGLPQALAAVADGPSRIIVTWGPSQGAGTYEIQADGVTVSGVHSPFLHRDLQPASVHTYRVRALNEAGQSPWTEPVSCTTERATSGR